MSEQAVLLSSTVACCRVHGRSFPFFTGLSPICALNWWGSPSICSAISPGRLVVWRGTDIPGTQCAALLCFVVNDALSVRGMSMVISGQGFCLFVEEAGL